MGKTPPAGAVVIFDGKSAEAFKNGKISPERAERDYGVKR